MIQAINELSEPLRAEQFGRGVDGDPPGGLILLVGVFLRHGLKSSRLGRQNKTK